jgi:hypothetical protein
MDYLNGLNYKWVHYGSELFGNHVRRFLTERIGIRQIGVGRDNWPPQGNRNTAEKLLKDCWLINSVSDYGPGESIYYCYFFTTINHEQRCIYYMWIKGDIRPYDWTFRGTDKNAAIVFSDCEPSDRAYFGHIEHDKQVIPLAPLLSQVNEVQHLNVGTTTE